MPATSGAATHRHRPPVRAARPVLAVSPSRRLAVHGAPVRGEHQLPDGPGERQHAERRQARPVQAVVQVRHARARDDRGRGEQAAQQGAVAGAVEAPRPAPYGGECGRRRRGHGEQHQDRRGEHVDHGERDHREQAGDRRQHRRDRVRVAARRRRHRGQHGRQQQRRAVAGLGEAAEGGG
ncbi:hypothetical protein [Kitasatospora sp. NPDC097691]|uniref:hypothetical protein n=1 Tax=Kitasatospora sp. NPDC097691 TaxID=3157231 RepID=UPI0033340208